MRWAATGATLVFTLLALALTRLWLFRAGLPYNEQGRYFSEEAIVVFDESAVLVYSLLAIMLWAVASVFGYATYRLWRK